jgi:8-oxo-dGTP pyrophosphatase MutT (NUDIX family)
MSADRLLERVRACHTADLGNFVPWFVGAQRAGWIHRERVLAATAAPTPFATAGGALTLRGDDFAARSHGLAQLAERLARAGAVRPATGEIYPVPGPAGGEPLLAIDRAFVPWFGVHAFGVHLNGYVVAPRGLELWIARRARGKRTFPGHLDNMVAGGQSLGMTAMHTLVKEAHEEAGVPADLAARAVPAGELHYVQQLDRDLKVDTLACFDLELPPDFLPRPVDGEVEAFERWAAARVVASLVGDDAWKPNCALVALHFLLRRGLLDAGIDTGLDAGLDAGARARLWTALAGG